MIKKTQFVRLVGSVVEYKKMITQFQEDYGDNEIARFGDGPVSAIMDFLEDVMDDDKKAILVKWLDNNYNDKSLCLKDGHYCDVPKKGNLEGCKKIQIKSIPQLYDFLKQKRDMGV